MRKFYRDGSRKRVTSSSSHAIVSDEDDDRPQALASSERIYKRSKERGTLPLTQLFVQREVYLGTVKINSR
jgi:hypothetical protein